MAHIYRSPRKTWRFLSYIFTTAIILSLLSPFGATVAQASNPPTPTYPANSATTTSETDPPLGIPSFAWSAVPGATLYRLQVDNDLGFSQPIFLDITTRNLSFTPMYVNNLLADGFWYWRVRVDEPTPVSAWSPTMTFKKEWATATNKPVLMAPSADQLISFFDAPVFSWMPVVGAARYLVQIAKTPAGLDNPLYHEVTLSTAHQPNVRLENGEYFWRVIPEDRADHLGTSSDVQRFVASYGTYLTDMVPTLVSPTDERYPTFTPTFHWTAIEGAEHYLLEYTSDETCDFSRGTSLETRQTYYTPVDTMPNDFRYCWHVRVDSGAAVGDWSQTWHFRKRWNLKPTLLTPTNLYQTGLYPMFSWTPVPGAAKYEVQISLNPGFNPILEKFVTANTTYAHQSKYISPSHYWWRVYPIDGGDEYGVPSDPAEYQDTYLSTAPILVSPLYYYIPNNFAGITMNPYEDRTVAFPIFQWHRVLNPSGGTFATAYRIQVDVTPDFSPPVWEYDTENTSATPDASDDFTPLVGQDYFWRVCPLSGMGGSCLINSGNGQPWWSQVWRARFDSSLQLQPTTGATPELLRPMVAQDSVEATPLLEWWPLDGATQYQVEVSRESSFSTYEISKTVNIPAYSPVHSLAQRRLGSERLDYGTFYWRVRGLVGSVWSGWSSAWRFQVSSQSEWRFTRTLGNPDNRLVIGKDPNPADAGFAYDLTNLYASQSNGYWFLGFNANITNTTDATYAIYLDLDNQLGSGGVGPPPRAYSVSTVPEHQPEFVIYVDMLGGVINSSNTRVYAWDGSTWGFGQKFIDIGGSVYAASNYVELQIPNGAIGMNQETSNASVMLFSVDRSSGIVQDTVPADPAVPGNAVLSRFSAVSEHMNLVYPTSTATGDPTTNASFLPFSWDWPTGSNSSTPFAGCILQVDTDQDYSQPHEAQFQIISDSQYFSENNVSLLFDAVGDNIYYWRVQPRYMQPGQEAYGAWSEGWSFRRLGVVPQNLQTSVSFATPTFSWDMAEGAQTYHLQVSTDPNFGSRAVDITTPMNSYTPTDALNQGHYYWRVQVKRYQDIGNDWSEVKQFTLTMPTPAGLSPNQTPDQGHVNYAPTLCWYPVVGNDNDEPVFTSWKYHVEVSLDATFSLSYDHVDTFSNCWTPIKGYRDGTFYWKVAMVDGNYHQGYYSPTATFTKQYPVSTLVSPLSGAVSSTPTFIWTPVFGAGSYKLETSLYATFYPLIESVETVNTKYTPQMAYPAHQQIYWRVAIKDRDNEQGPFNDASFIIGIEKYFFIPNVSK